MCVRFCYLDLSLPPSISLPLSLKHTRTHTHTPHTHPAQVLWRLARLCFKVGKYHTKDQEEMKQLAGQGWSYIERGLALGGDKHNGCQRWAGVLLSWSSEFEGTKKKIEKSFEIREHFLVRELV